MGNSGSEFNMFEHKLDLALRNDDVEYVQKMIGDGLELNWLNSDGESLLSAAVYHEAHNVIHELIASGADVNIKDKDWHGDGCDTPLNAAARINDIEVVRLLIDAGANVNHQGEFGSTPLHNTDCGECQKLLLENGADPSIKNNDGWTADDLNACRVQDRMFSGQDYSQAVGSMNLDLGAEQRALEQRSVLQQAIEDEPRNRQSVTRRM